MANTLRIGSQMPVAMLDGVKARFPSVEVVEVPGEGAVDAALELDVRLTLPWGTPNLADVLSLRVRVTHFGYGRYNVRGISPDVCQTNFLAK